jgi:REP element-mobilizing transposase RayT
MVMKYNPEIHHRRSIRLKNYDYGRAGAYFITICIQGRQCILGTVVNGTVELNEYGSIIEQVWQGIPNHYPLANLDAAIAMPNHFHGILLILDKPINSNPQNHANVSRINRPKLGQIVAYFKYQSTKLINALRNTPGEKVWQRNYYEHVIRHEDSLKRLREYIMNNPKRWQEDQLHPENLSK